MCGFFFFLMSLNTFKSFVHIIAAEVAFDVLDPLRGLFYIYIKHVRRVVFRKNTAGGSVAPQIDARIRSPTGQSHFPPTPSNLTGLSSWYLATLNASMEIDVSEIKGNSEIQTSVSLHWDRAGGKLAWCAVNVSQSTEYYPPTVPWLWAVRTPGCFWSK